MSDDAPSAGVPASPVTAPGGARDADPAADRAGREPGELLTGLSPRQIIGGFTLVAGVILWLARRSRRKR
jgi:hypothetical protein